MNAFYGYDEKIRREVLQIRIIHGSGERVVQSSTLMQVFISEVDYYWRSWLLITEGKKTFVVVVIYCF